jgi:hypothetical protein
MPKRVPYQILMHHPAWSSWSKRRRPRFGDFRRRADMHPRTNPVDYGTVYRAPTSAVAGALIAKFYVQNGRPMLGPPPGRTARSPPSAPQGGRAIRARVLDSQVGNVGGNVAWSGYSPG